MRCKVKKRYYEVSIIGWPIFFYVDKLKIWRSFEGVYLYPWFVRYNTRRSKLYWTSAKAWRKFYSLADLGYDVTITVHTYNKNSQEYREDKSWAVSKRYLDGVRKKLRTKSL
jgi:hypothetical protein